MEKIRNNFVSSEDYSKLPSYLMVDDKNYTIEVKRLPEIDEISYVPKIKVNVALQALN